MSNPFLFGEDQLFLGIDLDKSFSSDNLELVVFFYSDADEKIDQVVLPLDNLASKFLPSFRIRLPISQFSGRRFRLGVRCLIDSLGSGEPHYNYIAPRSIFISDDSSCLTNIDLPFEPTISIEDTLRARSVIIGTTSSCNASCEHCPTNKPIDGVNAPGSVMSIDLFEKIIHELSSRFEVAGSVSLGLFNDSLTDPLLLKRSKILRKKLPGKRISINTNFALYDECKHFDALKEFDEIAIQVSGYTQETYEKLMFPLVRDRVFSRIEEFARKIADQNHDIAIAIEVPVSSQTIYELDLLKEWVNTLPNKNKRIDLLPFSNRCGDNPAYEKLAISPSPGACRGDALNDIIVDYDGELLSCCQDFQRRNNIGSLSKQSILNAFEAEEWQNFRRNLDNKNWDAIESCSKCKFDSSVESLTIERYKNSL